MSDGLEASSIVQADTPQSAGGMLRAAREASGLHIAALAVSMKVPVKKLEALESDRMDLLSDAVFVRALASSVCRALKIDSAPILSKLPRSVVPRLGVAEQHINAPFYSPGQERRLAVPVLLSKPSVLAVIVLLLAAAFLVFSPQNTNIEKQEEFVQTGANVPAVEIEPPANKSGISPQQTEAVSSMGTPAAEHPPSALTPLVDMKISQVNADASKVQTTTSSESGKSVEFKARGVSWVDVTDSKGVNRLRKTMASGESLSVTGDFPLTIIVGRADLTEVLVRGKPFPILGFSKDNVARFEVN